MSATNITSECCDNPNIRDLTHGRGKHPNFICDHCKGRVWEGNAYTSSEWEEYVNRDFTYGIHVYVEHSQTKEYSWKWMQTPGGVPYSFPTKQQAERMMDMCSDVINYDKMRVKVYERA